ncbi:hypothetical protein D1872_257870 [compost metagenome]
MERNPVQLAADGGGSPGVLRYGRQIRELVQIRLHLPEHAVFDGIAHGGIVQDRQRHDIGQRIGGECRIDPFFLGSIGNPGNFEFRIRDLLDFGKNRPRRRGWRVQNVQPADIRRPFGARTRSAALGVSAGARGSFPAFTSAAGGQQ